MSRLSRTGVALLIGGLFLVAAALVWAIDEWLEIPFR